MEALSQVWSVTRSTGVLVGIEENDAVRRQDYFGMSGAIELGAVPTTKYFSCKKFNHHFVGGR